MSNSWLCVDANLVIRLVADPADTSVQGLAEGSMRSSSAWPKDHEECPTHLMGGCPTRSLRRLPLGQNPSNCPSDLKSCIQPIIVARQERVVWCLGVANMSNDRQLDGLLIKVLSGG